MTESLCLERTLIPQYLDPHDDDRDFKRDCNLIENLLESSYLLSYLFLLFPHLNVGFGFITPTKGVIVSSCCP